MFVKCAGMYVCVKCFVSSVCLSLKIKIFAPLDKYVNNPSTFNLLCLVIPLCATEFYYSSPIEPKKKVFVYCT